MPIPDITVMIASNRPQWFPWAAYQVAKQFKYLATKNVVANVIICTEYVKEAKKCGFSWVLECPTEMSVGGRRNMLVRESNGEYLAFMDDDDWYPEYRLHYQWSYLFCNSNKQKIFAITTDEPLCYDIHGDYTFKVPHASESCLMFHKAFTKDKKGKRRLFEGSKGEGGTFIGSEPLFIENSVILVMALSHQSNTVERKLNESFPKKINGLYEGIKLDEFENYFINSYKCEK